MFQYRRAVRTASYCATYAGLLGLMIFLVLSAQQVPRADEPSPARGPTDLLRLNPRVVRTRSKLAETLPRQDLEAALARVEPFWEVRTAAIVLHALRLWGPAAVFPDAPVVPVPARVKPMQSADMIKFFLDEYTFQSCFLGDEPYFFRTRDGVALRVSNDMAANAHQDDFLALAGEIGLDLNTRFSWTDSGFSLRDVFSHSLAWFYPDQELEFTTVALAHYLNPAQSWTNRFDEMYTIEQVAENLLERAPSKLACHGTHLPYALAVLWSVSQEEPLLSADMVKRVENKLKAFSCCLEKAQGAAGWWNRNWMTGEAAIVRMDAKEDELIRSTGHHLEWIALVDPDLRPSEDSIRLALRFILKAMRNRPPRLVPGATLFNEYSHAGRALTLHVGRQFASEVMQENWTKRCKRPSRPAQPKSISRP